MKKIARIAPGYFFTRNEVYGCYAAVAVVGLPRDVLTLPSIMQSFGLAVGAGLNEGYARYFAILVLYATLPTASR